MEKVAPNSKFVSNSTEIIRQCKIKWPLKIAAVNKVNENFIQATRRHFFSRGIVVKNTVVFQIAIFSC